MVNVDDTTNALELSKVEAKAIDDYIRDIYAKKVPEPLPPSKADLSFWKIAGIEAILFTIAGFGVITYSAIRTGGLFYIMETLLLQKYNLPSSFVGVLSLSSMISSLAAFELFVLADGFVKGKNNTTLKRSDVGLLASLGVIVAAGIFTGFALLPGLDSRFELIFYITIAVFTAIAGGLVALYSGENIGYTFSKVEMTRKTLLDKHRDNYQSWKESGIRAYNSSHYAVGSKKATAFAKNVTEVITPETPIVVRNPQEPPGLALPPAFPPKNNRPPNAQEAGKEKNTLGKI